MIDKVKQGRKYIYKVEETGTTSQELAIKNIIRTYKVEEFKKYYSLRVSDRAYTVDELAAAAQVSKPTILKWDKLLLLHRVIVKDGFYYYRRKAGAADKSPCSKEEYKNYFVNRQQLKDLLTIRPSTKGQQMEALNKVIEDQLDFVTSHYYHRVKKYLANKQNPLFWELLGNSI